MINVKTLLVIDDDTFFCKLVSEIFSNQDIRVLSAHTGKDGLMICEQEKVDVIILDQKLPDIEGATLCQSILSHNDRAKIIFITAYPSFDHAVEALRSGAYDYLSKPFENEELNLTVEKAFRTTKLEQVEQIQNYHSKMENQETVLIGSDPGFQEVCRLIELSGKNDAAVLITGNTGTGKNIAAKAIHYKGFGPQSVFMSINCAALPENLIESELFGYEKGAFTGATNTQKGIFEMTDGGTLFLDEIGEMPLHLQSKLLGVLDDKKVRRLGSRTSRPVNVRIIAATNTDLEKAIQNKHFREDLYFRLSVIRIHIPPLSQRINDIPELCRHFISILSPTPDITLTSDEIAKLKAYQWPGNIRELKNLIERAIILRTGNKITPSSLLGNNFSICNEQQAVWNEMSQIKSLEEVEHQHILTTLDMLSNNHTRTADSLGISRSTLIRKMKKYRIGPHTDIIVSN